MKKLSILIAVMMMSAVLCQAAHADSIAVLRQGLLGAGTGAIATAATGSKGDRIWQGALIGAGVNVVGGALLDMMTGERVGTVTYVQPSQPVVYVQKVQPVPIQYQPVRPRRANSAQRRIYKQGFKDGYERGYQDGYADAQYDMYGY